MKMKYKECLKILQNLNFVSVDRAHEDIAKLLIYSNKKPNAGTLQSRFYYDGYLSEDELLSIQKVLKQEIFLTEKSVNNGIQLNVNGENCKYEITHQLADNLKLDIDKSEIIYAAGNSMEPYILSGDILLIDLKKNKINDGKIYCVKHQGQLKIKRLQQLSASQIKLISDNIIYEPIMIDLNSDFSEDFEVIGEIRRIERILN